MQSNKRIFAWASRLSMRYEAMDICSEYLKEKTSSPIDALIRIYNSAFGSSFEDGISPSFANGGLTKLILPIIRG